MAYGSINYNTSRRDYFLRCFLFEANSKNDILTNEVKSKAIFFSKYINPERNSLAQLNDLFQNKQSTLVIETQDNVQIEPNNFIAIGRNLYIVIDSTREPFYKSSQFMARPYYKTIINLQGV